MMKKEQDSYPTEWWREPLEWWVKLSSHNDQTCSQLWALPRRFPALSSAIWMALITMRKEKDNLACIHKVEIGLGRGEIQPFKRAFSCRLFLLDFLSLFSSRIFFSKRGKKGRCVWMAKTKPFNSVGLKSSVNRAPPTWPGLSHCTTFPHASGRDNSINSRGKKKSECSW